MRVLDRREFREVTWGGRGQVGIRDHRTVKGTGSVKPEGKIN